MEKDELLSIKKSIESGQYFKDAFDWYCMKYLFCITNRAHVVIGLVVSALFLGFSFYALYSAFPISSKYPLVKYTSRNSDEFSIVHRLESDSASDSTQDIVTKYLVKQYVMMHESYQEDKYELQKNFIQNNSARKVFLDFTDMMSISNPDSPVLKYRGNDKKYVEILSVKLYKHGDDDEQSDAIVKFKIHDIINNTQSVRNDVARLQLVISNVKLAARKLTSFQFLVNKYEVE